MFKLFRRSTQVRFNPSLFNMGLSQSSVIETPVKNMSSTVNQAEVDKFSAMSSDWWNPRGVCKPLHSMNRLRVPLVRDGLMETGVADPAMADTDMPLQGVRILDVGCGAGILSEALARIGADVTGIDACHDNIEAAKHHAEAAGDSLGNLRYICTSVEELAEAGPESYDAVVASEVVEHVANPEMFVAVMAGLARPRGSVFLTTLSRTRLSWLVAILGAEYVAGLLPRGTHDWDKFITPRDLQKLVEAAGCQTRLVHGMAYNPLANSWCWIGDTSVNYALHAVKLDTDT